MNDEDESSDSGQIARPRESHEGDRRDVVDEHLPKVLAFYVEKLDRKKERN